MWIQIKNRSMEHLSMKKRKIIRTHRTSTLESRTGYNESE